MTEHENDSNPDDVQLGDAGKRAIKAERDARKALERQLREANARVAELERADIVRDVAAAKGIDPKLAARLQGTTREELEADADAFLELVAPPKDPGLKPLGRPTENLRGGADPTTPVEPNAKEIADNILSN